MDEYLREAVEADLDLLFDWANDPEVRRNSFSMAEIAYEEHRKWFLDLLQDGSRKQYIYMADQFPVGQIRVTIQADKAEIGYSICKERRGRGYGKRMLALLQKQLLEDVPGVRTLAARVKGGNTASEHAFLDSGYQKKYTLFELELKE